MKSVIFMLSLLFACGVGADSNNWGDQESGPTAINCGQELETLYLEAVRIYAPEYQGPVEIPQIILHEDGYGWIYWHQAYAAYQDWDNTIHINVRMVKNLAPLDACSVYVHEFVHALQHTLGANKDSSVNELEKEAYTVQLEYIYGKTPADQRKAAGNLDVVMFKRMQKHLAMPDESDLDYLKLKVCHMWKSSKSLDIGVCEWETP